MSPASLSQQLFPDFRNYVLLQHEASELRRRAEIHGRSAPVVAAAMRSQATVLASKAREAWLDRVRTVAPRVPVTIGSDGAFRVGDVEFTPNAVELPSRS